MCVWVCVDGHLWRLDVGVCVGGIQWVVLGVLHRAGVLASVCVSHEQQ